MVLKSYIAFNCIQLSFCYQNGMVVIVLFVVDFCVFAMSSGKDKITPLSFWGDVIIVSVRFRVSYNFLV